MSRLIDADTLMKSMYHRAFETDGDTMWQSGCWVRYRAIEQVVKEQPTIEPKKGKWIDSWRSKMDGTRYWYRECDHCGYERNDCDSEKDSNFCPNCGADMRGDEA